MVTRQARSAKVGSARLLLAAASLAALAGCAGAGQPAPEPPAAATAAPGSAEDRPDRRPAYTLYHTETDDGAADKAAQLGGGTGGGAAAVAGRPEGSDLGEGSGGRADRAPGDASGDYDHPSDASMNGSAGADHSDDGEAGSGAAVDVSTGTAEGDGADGSDGGGVAVRGDSGGVVDSSDGGGTVGEGTAEDDDLAAGGSSAEDEDGPGGGAADLSDAPERGEAGAEVADGSGGDGVEAGIAGMRLVVDGVGGVLVEGPCGWVGPVCPLAEGADPIDAGGPLVYWLPFEDWSVWVGRVLDLCDDHEALVALDKGWFIGARTRIDYTAAVPPEALEFVHAERRRHPVSCGAEPPAPLWKCWGDGSGRNIARLHEYLGGFAEPPEPSEVIAWAEGVGMECWDAAAAGVRYVYVTANGPLLPQSSVEAAVEDYLERAALAGEEHGGLTVGLPLGADYPFYAYRVEAPEDSLVVLAESVSVRDGALRGLAQNRSERLWARDVTVTAAGPDGGDGEWRWPLTVQPGELLPFEIERWAGAQTLSEIDIAITADLSPTIDLTRSLELYWQDYYDTKSTYLSLWDYLSEEMGAFPYGTMAFEALDGSDSVEWTDFTIRLKGSTAHPRLVEAAEQQTVENLAVYAAIVKNLVVDEVWEMTPMARTPGQYGDGSEEAWARGDPDEWNEGDWVETRTISAGGYATVGRVGSTFHEGDLHIWAGGAAAPRPAGDETQ